MLVSSEQNPRVSVCIVSYNHAPFIERALQTVIEQSTPFPFEVIVADDESPDGTRAIAERYIANSGAPVRLLDASPRLGARDNVLRAFAAARGEFIAYLESDDYWTCQSKLSEQVALLDSRRDLSGCFGRASVISAAGEFLGDYFEYHHTSAPEREIDQRTAIERGISAPACTLMFRASVLTDSPEWFRKIASHQALGVLSTGQGPVKFVDRNWGCYRIHGGGVWSSASAIKRSLVDYEYAVALAADAAISRKHPREVGTRLLLASFGLARQRVRSGQLGSIAELPRDLAPAVRAASPRLVGNALPVLFSILAEKAKRSMFRTPARL